MACSCPSVPVNQWNDLDLIHTMEQLLQHFVCIKEVLTNLFYFIFSIKKFLFLQVAYKKIYRILFLMLTSSGWKSTCQCANWTFLLIFIQYRKQNCHYFICVKWHQSLYLGTLEGLRMSTSFGLQLIVFSLTIISYFLFVTAVFSNE